MRATLNLYRHSAILIQLFIISPGKRSFWDHFNLRLLEISLSYEQRRSFVDERRWLLKGSSGDKGFEFHNSYCKKHLILYLDVVKYLNSRLRYEPSDTLIFVSFFSLVLWGHVTCEIHDFTSSLVQPTEMIPSKEENNNPFENLV